MSLIVNNVINASSQISYSYLDSKEVFGYLITLTYSINVQDTQFDDDSGVLLTGRSALREAYKQRNITARIAGDDIHNGLIKSMSFEESALVGEETVNLVIEERRALSDYSSKTFAKYIPSPHLLSSFEENYTFSRSGDSYTYSRTISIQYAQDAGDQFLTNAKVFLTNYYYENRPSFGYYEDGISENAKFDQGFNGKLKENIDLVGLSVSLTEDFSSSFIDEANNVSKIITTSEGVDGRGYLFKNITINLTSLRLDSEKVLNSAMSSIIDEVITEEQSGNFGEPSSIQKGVAKDGSSASITISFSTDPTTSQEKSVTYTCDKAKNGEYLDYTLIVTYKARGKNISTRYDETISLWNSQRENNAAKVVALFSEATSIYEKSRSVQIAKTQGIVTETIVFTTQDSYNSAGLPAGILKHNIQVSKTEKIPRTSKVLDLINLKEKLVVSDLKTIGQASVTATAVCLPSYGIMHAKDFLNDTTRTNQMNAALEEDNYYGVSDQISIDLRNGTASRVINYIIT